MAKKQPKLSDAGQDLEPSGLAAFDSVEPAPPDAVEEVAADTVPAGDLVPVDPVAPVAPPAPTHWRVSLAHCKPLVGGKPQDDMVIEADSQEAAWEAFKRHNGITHTSHRPSIVPA